MLEFVNEISTGEAEQMLMELYDETGDNGVIPKLPEKYFTVNEERKDLTVQEYDQLTAQQGQTAHDIHIRLA